MNLGIAKLISGKHVFSQLMTVIGGTFVLLGIWTSILYVQTEPHYKFNAEAYLNLLQKIEAELEGYQTKVEAITSGFDTISQVQGERIDELLREPKNQQFTVALDSNDKSSIYTFTDFLTPREVIRDFLNILSILRQNPKLDKRKLFGDIKIRDERPKELAFENIEEI